LRIAEIGVVPLNNPNTSTADTDYVQNLSEEEQGFIYSTYPTVEVDTRKFNYSTYSTAEISPYGDNLSVKGSNQGYAYLSSAVGGSVSELSFKDNARNQSRSAKGGCIRRKIRGFSRVSRRNLLRRFASINRPTFRAFKGRVLFITLTYPTDYPEDPEECKKHLEALGKRLEREYGALATFWRMGIQRRGAWHFHLLLFVPPSLGSVVEIRHFMASSWYKVCGEVGEGHLLKGTYVEEVSTWRKAISYVEKYMAKEEAFPEGIETGRIWGVWNKKLLPIKWETVRITFKDAYKIRRVYRRLAKMRGKGHLRRLTVFVRYENVARLLEFLGYRQEE
jgi:hypothetical protein